MYSVSTDFREETMHFARKIEEMRNTNLENIASIKRENNVHSSPIQSNLVYKVYSSKSFSSFTPSVKSTDL